MKSSYFEAIQTETISGSLIFLDIDGTLVPDSSEDISERARTKVEELKSKNDIVLLSNTLTRDRVSRVARILNLPYISPRYPKPHPKALGEYHRDPRQKVVIGDKLLTDGLLAFLLRARFVYVTPLRDRPTESLLARFFYDIEFALGVLVRYGAPLRFLVSGGTAALVLLTSLYIFTDFFGIWYLVSSVMAFLLAFMTSFTLHKFWTFKDHSVSRVAHQAAGHFIVGILNLLLNTASLYLLVEHAGLHYLVAQFCTSAVLAAGSFFVYKHLIFRGGVAGAFPKSRHTS